MFTNPLELLVKKYDKKKYFAIGQVVFAPGTQTYVTETKRMHFKHLPSPAADQVHKIKAGGRN
jgi:hypothetical protein